MFVSTFNCVKNYWNILLLISTEPTMWLCWCYQRLAKKYNRDYIACNCERMVNEIIYYKKPEIYKYINSYIYNYKYILYAYPKREKKHSC